MSYTKLHQELVQSSVWSEPDHVRIMWVTLLSQADREGYVYGSPVGLARLAALDVPRAIDALERLGQPDPYSQNKAEEGRRIVPEDIEGRTCYRIVTHAFYRALKSDEERKRTIAEKQARYRARKAVTSTVTECRPSVTPLSVSGSDLNQEEVSATAAAAKSALQDGWAPDEDTLSRIVKGSQQAKGVTRDFALDAVERFVDYFTTKGKGGGEKRTPEGWQTRFKLWVWDNWKGRDGDDYRRANGVPLKAAPIKLDM